jgi:hypothetical protein
MKKRSFLISVALVVALLTAAILAGQQSIRSPSATPATGSRYQLFDGPVTTVFDTQTGKVYKWLPRDEKAGKDPSIFVMDPVNGQGIEVEIKWTKKSAQ